MTLPPLINHQTSGVLAILLIMAGLVASEALMSIGMILLSANLVFNRKLGQHLKHAAAHQGLMALVLIFVLFLISGLWSENLSWWIDRMRMKLPLLMLPFAVVAIPRMGKQLYLKLLFVFFIWINLAAAYSLLMYVLDFEAITHAYREGRVLPTPVQHIRFSLMVAFSIAIGVYLNREQFIWKNALEKRLIQWLTAFLFIYIHILAVRSGLLALYVMMVYYALLLIVEHRQYRNALLLSLAVLVAAGLAYRYLPSFQNRINYTLYSLRMFEKQEQISDLSDARRVGSLHAAFDIMKKYPLTGVGAGDIRDATDAYLQREYPALAGFQLMPHNQFLLVGAALGIPAMLIFLACMVWPWIYRQAWRDPLFTAFQLLILSSCLVEHTLETQLGTAIYILFSVLMLRHFDEPHLNRSE
jgi:O-antigen ligase